MGGGTRTGVAGGGVKDLVSGIPHGGFQGDRATEGRPLVTPRAGGSEGIGHLQRLRRHDLRAFLQSQVEDGGILGIDGKHAVRFDENILIRAAGRRESLIAGDLDRFQVAHARKDRYRAIGCGSGEARDRRFSAIKAFLPGTGISARYRPELVGLAGRNDRG